MLKRDDIPYATLAAKYENSASRYVDLPGGIRGWASRASGVADGEDVVTHAARAENEAAEGCHARTVARLELAAVLRLDRVVVLTGSLHQSAVVGDDRGVPTGGAVGHLAIVDEQPTDDDGVPTI